MPTKEELKELQSKSLEEKIQISTARIIEWYETWGGRVYVSNSGGVDSTVLSHLVHRIYPEVPDVYCDTGLEYPELREFILNKPNIIVLKPQIYNRKTRKYEDISFAGVITKYGYPLISKEQSEYIREFRNSHSEKFKKLRIRGNKWGRGKISKKWQIFEQTHKEILVDNKCCFIMKKNPAKLFEKNSGLHPFVGTMTEESDLRQSNWMRYGCNMFSNERPISAPLSFWSKNDILHYLKKYNVPYASVYGNIVENNSVYTTTKCKRTGCIFCGYGCHLEPNPNKFQQLAITHPKLYDYCIRGGKFDETGHWIPNKGLGMAKVLDAINVQWWNTEEERDKYRKEYQEKEKEYYNKSEV